MGTCKGQFTRCNKLKVISNIPFQHTTRGSESSSKFIEIYRTHEVPPLVIYQMSIWLITPYVRV